jgi:hypothetical protein
MGEIMNSKTCSSCGIEKDKSEFYRKGSSADGYNNICKACIKERHADYYKKNEEKIRAYRRNYGRIFRYGISEADVVQMIESQGGKCAICEGRIESNAHVDHDHETGKVRAVLCKNCNIALGLLGDDIGNIVRAADYLMLHKWGEAETEGE